MPDRPSHLSPRRPRLSPRAAAAAASARRYHDRVRRQGDGDSPLTEAEREQRRLLLLVGAGVLSVFCLWCSTRSVPLIEADVDITLTRLLEGERIDWVQAEVIGRKVSLFGVAPSADARARIVDTITRLGAVASVDDHLVIASKMPTGQVRAPGPSAARAATDASRQLTLAFDGTRLTLTGTIGATAQAEALLQQAEQRYTRESVISELTLTDGLPDVWPAAAKAAVAALALLEAGRAVLRGDVLAVAGAAPDATTLSSLLAMLDEDTPDGIQLRADVVPLYRDGEPDASSCRRAVELLLRAGELTPSGEFSGLTPASRTTLDQVARIMQSCNAGALVLVPGASDIDLATSRRLFADDVRNYLLTRGFAPGLVALADTPAENGPDTAVDLALVMADTNAAMP